MNGQLKLWSMAGLALFTSALCGFAADAMVYDFSGWKIAVTPGDSPTPSTVVPQTALYRDIYNSIPFSRAEYNANPSYRHDATMEFLFNQMRPTVIQRTTAMANDYNYHDSLYFYPQQPYYPYSYGLRIHRSR